MKKVLIITALPQELKWVKDSIIKSKNLSIDFLQTWVWNLNVVYSLKSYIFNKWKPDFIINIGACWCKNDKYKDFFQVYKIKNLSNNREVIVPVYTEYLDLKWIYCSDKIITSKNELIEEDFVDMESYWIDFICDKEKIPYILIKKPFDIVSKNSKKVDLEELKNSFKDLDYDKLLLLIEEFFNKEIWLNYENEIALLKEKFRLTFSETNILKNYINKKISFWENFLDIYNYLIWLEKEKFLEEIKI